MSDKAQERIARALPKVVTALEAINENLGRLHDLVDRELTLAAWVKPPRKTQGERDAGGT